MGYREFKRDLYNGNLFEGVRAAAVGKHEVLLKEDAGDICTKLASLLKRLKDLLTVSLYGNKGKFEEDDLRSIFAEYDMDVPSAKRFLSSLLESRVEEGRSVSYISSTKKRMKTSWFLLLPEALTCCSHVIRSSALSVLQE